MLRKPFSIEYFFERIFVKYRKQGNILYITYSSYNFFKKGGGGLVFIYSKKQTLIKIYISKLNQYDVIYMPLYPNVLR